MVTVRHDGWLATVSGGMGIVKVYDHERHLKATINSQPCFSDEEAKRVIKIIQQLEVEE